MDTNDLRRRVGKIKVSETFFWDLKTIGVLLKNCIVLEVDHYDYSRRRVYTVVCPEFDRLADGEAVPEYIATVKVVDGSYVELGKWEKVT